MHGVVTYLFVIPLFPRGPWPLACGLLWFACGGVSWFLCFWFCASPFVLFPPPFFLTRTSRLGPMARTLLGGLGHATLKFFVVAARLFLLFCVCPKFCDLAKQRRKIFWGVSEVREKRFLCLFLSAVRLFLFFFPVAIARRVLS